MLESLCLLISDEFNTILRTISLINKFIPIIKSAISTIKIRKNHIQIGCYHYVPCLAQSLNLKKSCLKNPDNIATHIPHQYHEEIFYRNSGRNGYCNAIYGN